MLYHPKSEFLTPFTWQKKKRTKYFQQYVHDAIMIQAENNNISLTEFSNVSGHFMEDVNTPQNGFLFLLLNYSRTSRYGHFSNTDTSIYYGQFPMSQQNSHIFSLKKNPYNTDSLSYGQRTLNLVPRE